MRLRSSAKWIWIVLSVMALWWPSRLSGPLDGVPFDSAPDAILLGLLLPALCWLHGRFLDDRRARAVVVALLVWKAFGAAALTQDGWCVSVVPSRPYVKDGTGPPHSWDIRADWRSASPSCSAIMTRAYTRFEDFPVWFFNLPAANGDMPRPEDWPPKAITTMTITGTLTARDSGVFRLVASPAIEATVRLAGQVVPEGSSGVAVSPGSHALAIDVTLTGNDWQLTPLWDGEDMWAHVTATTMQPSLLDKATRPWARWVSCGLVAVLLAAWVVAALARVGDAWALVWMLAASAALAFVAIRVPEQRWHYAVAALTGASLLPVRERVRTIRGAFLLIGIPWLVLTVVVNREEFGRMTLYMPGNDWWEFQRFAYRIFLQGYWLEGGEPTFWFQPLYRWVAGALHLLFGDSSVGEEYWDGAWLVVIALFSFHVVHACAGARWGLLAAGLTLGVFMAGPGFIFVGHGLSEITSAGFIYLAALFALRGRDWWPAALAAGICATLGAWTRLNNLPMAAAVIAFAWPLEEPVRTLWRPRAWFDRASTRTMLVIAATLAVGFMLFALRTWYYTDRFSVFFGTALDETRGSARRVWQPGMTPAEGFRSMYDSLMMVLTTTDPPHVHNGSIPLIAGVVLALLAVTGIGVLGELPLALVLFCLASLVGSLVARGTAYTGRFSIHIIGAATAVLICAVARMAARALAIAASRRTQDQRM